MYGLNNSRGPKAGPGPHAVNVMHPPPHVLRRIDAPDLRGSRFSQCFILFIYSYIQCSSPNKFLCWQLFWEILPVVSSRVFKLLATSCLLLRQFVISFVFLLFLYSVIFLWDSNLKTTIISSFSAMAFVQKQSALLASSTLTPLGSRLTDEQPSEIGIG